jgi:hypothetical protein
MASADAVFENAGCLAVAEDLAKLHDAATTDYERGMKDAASIIAVRIRARLD